jgi:hypothetical protein
MPGSLWIRDAWGHEEMLTRHRVSHAKKTLGVFFAMDGNQKGEHQYLRQLSEEFGAQMTQTKISKNDAMYSLESSFMATVEYALPATCFNQNEWHIIMAPALQATLRKSGMAANFPCTILYTPTRYQGLGLLDPYHHQNALHIINFLEQMTQGSITGNLMMVNCEDISLQLGLGTDIGGFFDIDYGRFGQLIEKTWMKHLWQTMDLNPDIQFITPLKDPPLLRDNDQYLMQLFGIKHKGKELETLNHMRTSQEMVSLADIVTANGRAITQEAFNLEGSNQLRTELGGHGRFRNSPRMTGLYGKSTLRGCGRSHRTSR